MRIMRKYDDLTASEKKVADAVLMLGENIIDHNIASLAIESRVSEPTVVRFCRSIGLGGIKELKKAALQSTIAESPPTSSSMDLNKLETDEQLIPFVIDNLTFILNETKKLIREDSLQKAIELLSNTTYVKIVGYGGPL